MTQSRFNAFVLSLHARHRGAATLAALALLVAGCGGGSGSGNGAAPRLSKTQYEARLQKDGQDVRDAFTPLSKRVSSLSELAREIKAGQEKLRSSAADLASVTPPKEVEHDNDVLVAGLRKLALQLDPLRKASAKGDARGVQAAVADLQSSTALKDAQKATQDMKDKGYKLGALGD